MGKTQQEKHESEQRAMKRFNALFIIISIVLIFTFLGYFMLNLGREFNETTDSEKARSAINTCSTISTLYGTIFAIFFFFAFNFLAPLDKAVDWRSWVGLLLCFALIAFGVTTYLISKPKDEIDAQTVTIDFNYTNKQYIAMITQICLMSVIFVALISVLMNREFCTASHN